MHRLKTHIFLFVLFLFFPLLVSSHDDVLSKIADIEGLLDSTASPWRLKIGDVVQAEKPDLNDSSWENTGKSWRVDSGVFWVRHDFTVPHAFSGVLTEGSPLHLVCRFHGLGRTEGRFYFNGILQESFTLEFGNQSAEIEKTFPLQSHVKPGEQECLAIRFENLGRLPLVDRKDAEPGTFVQLRDAHYLFESARPAHEELSRFLLDLKTAAVLLDIEPAKPLPPNKTRPISPVYLKAEKSKDFQRLKLVFEKAVSLIDIQAVRNGDYSRVKASVARFYDEAASLVEFIKNYTLFIGGNSHIDLAWLWRWRETVDVTRATFSTILDNMDEYPDIVYIQSQAQAYKWIEDYYPEIFQRIRDKVKEGRWEIVGGMWAEPDCNLIDGESFIRQILYGKRYFRDKFGVDVQIGWNPDSFGYNWNMPQFLIKSGFHTFVTQKISWNDTNVFPYFLFWWEAPDGSRILTYFPPTGYVGRLQAESMIEGAKEFERNTGLKKTFILYGLGDHGGGPNRKMLDRVKEYTKQRIFPRIKNSSFEQFNSELSKANLKDIPVWKDELYLEYHRGTYTTQSSTKRWNRKSEALLSNAEKFSSLALLFGRDYPQNSLKAAWEKVLMNQFHDILPGSSIHPVYRDAEESYLEASNDAEKELQQSLALLSQQIDTSREKEGTPLVVFNPLSWERTDLVNIPIPLQLQKKKLFVSCEGEEIPSQIVSEKDDQRICFTAKSVPAFGYKVFKIREGESVLQNDGLIVEENVLENRFFRLTIHPESGNIVSLFDKRVKKEVLLPQGQGNQLQLFEDIPDYWDAWNIQYTGRSWMLDRADRIEIQKKGPVMASIKVGKNYLGLSKVRREPTTEFPSSFFTQEIILYADIPRIDIAMTADWWEDHVLLKVAFPLDVQNTMATYEIPYAFIRRPTTRITDWAKARHEVPAIRWADLSDSNYGVSLLNESKYGHDIKDSTMRLTLLRSPLSPDPLADRGKHNFSYALYPHPGDWRTADTVLRGYEFNVPLLAAFSEEHGGILPPSLSFYSASPSNIILASVKKAEDRGSLILRLYEAEGRETEGIVEFFRVPEKIYVLNLMEERLLPLSAEGKRITLHFGPSEIKTVELVY